MHLLRAAARLERLDFSNAKLSSHQLVELVSPCQMQTNSNSSLTSLRLDKVNLSKFHTLR